MARWRVWACVCALVMVCATVALGGGPPIVAGPTRGGLNIVVPYYPPSPRAGGMGLATVALGGVDSHNPAALGFAKGIHILADYGRMSFDHGPDLDIYHGHLIFPAPKPIGGYAMVIGMAMSTR